jgi:hypothetical protein
MELRGDPAVKALIDSRGRLTNAQVGEKLRAEIEREKVRWRSVLGAVRSPQRRLRRLRRASALALYTPGKANFEVGFHLVQRCWGKGFATEAAFGALEYAWEKLRLSKVYAGHHPGNRASDKILKKLGFEFIGNVFYEPTGLMHPSYVCKAPLSERNTSTSP